MDESAPLLSRGDGTPERTCPELAGGHIPPLLRILPTPLDSSDGQLVASGGDRRRPAAGRARGRAARHGRARAPHARLPAFVADEFDLSPWGVAPGERAAVALPNGPEAAARRRGRGARACARRAPEHDREIALELANVRAKVVLVLGRRDRRPPRRPPRRAPAVELVPDRARVGLFRLRGAAPAATAPRAARRFTRRGDVALVLHTSGTSGKKKVVPYTLEQLVVGAACVAESWRLAPEDVNLNMMPLFHVGGIVRNVLGPLLSGGSLVAAPGFDAGLFWDLAEAPPGPTTAARSRGTTRRRRCTRRSCARGRSARARAACARARACA